MEHLALEIFDLTGTGGKFAALPQNTVIHIRRTSQVFGSGAVWSHDFTLNIPANAHIFGSAGDMHGSRLHEQIHKRKARLWAEGLPMFLGYLKLADEVEVDANGNIDISLESGQKTFEDMIADTKAREVSVGDVPIGVALNRKRVVGMLSPTGSARLTGLEAYAAKNSSLSDAANSTFSFSAPVLPSTWMYTPYVQQWPKLVKSQGIVGYTQNGAWVEENRDYTNVQTAYDSAHPFCNINICYPFKANDHGEEKSGRGYTIRLAHGGKGTTDGGDNQARYNNAPNFYLLHFIDRLFKDLKIHVSENQMEDVEDLRRVFMLNFGCHYEELESMDYDSENHTTPTNLNRYGQYYLPIIDDSSDKYLLDGWDKSCMQIQSDSNVIGKILLRDAEVTEDGVSLLKVGSLEGTVTRVVSQRIFTETYDQLFMGLSVDDTEKSHGAYSAYLAYATGDNYPNVDISEIVDAMKSMFGVRLLFSDDFKQVRIVLLRNIFHSKQVQKINCGIVSETKTENSIRGFRLTYGKGKDDTNFYYKGFNDLFKRAATTWKDTTDRHDYSQYVINADYSTIKQAVSATDKVCYITPVNGNAYAVKIDENEDVLFPSLFEVAGYMDAEDGDCSGESETIDEVTIGASPVIMNDVNGICAMLYSGDLKAPSPDDSFDYATKVATFARLMSQSLDNTLLSNGNRDIRVTGKLDIYISEGFQMRLKDNYSISNTGSPFDDADPGLCFGIMRGSGTDARIAYFHDEIENESPMNYYWEVIPGSGAIDHSDTCDSYGNEWDYNGTASGIGNTDGRVSLKLRAEKPRPKFARLYNEPSTYTQSTTVTSRQEAATAMTSIFRSSNTNLLNRPKVSAATMRAAGWTSFTGDYATVYSIQRGIKVSTGEIVEILWTPIRPDGTVLSPSEFNDYVDWFDVGATIEQVIGFDWSKEQLILDIYTTEERAELLHKLQAIYYGDNDVTVEPVIINPENTSSSSEAANQDGEYLGINTPSLRKRGLADQFYNPHCRRICS